MPILTVSLAQISVKAGNPRANWKKSKSGLQKRPNAVRPDRSPRIVGQRLRTGKGQRCRQSTGRGLFAEVVTLSRSANIHIIGSMLEKRGAASVTVLPSFRRAAA